MPRLGSDAGLQHSDAFEGFEQGKDSCEITARNESENLARAMDCRREKSVFICVRILATT